MRTTARLTILLATVLAVPAPGGAQGVVVDEGRFAVSLDGASAGTEDFTIRRAGLGRDDAFFANATVTLTRGGRTQLMRPLLRAAPPDGTAGEYQIEVTGVDALDLRLRRAGRRFTAVIRSETGEEQREFAADAATRVLEADVAHHYYFLREAPEGSVTPVLVPRLRGAVELVADSESEVELRSGQSVVPARRVDFTSGEERHAGWFDRLGRVLRVEVPARGYVAERVDLLR
jgi:hypothetical protein